MKRILAISLGLMHFSSLNTNNNLIFKNEMKADLPIPLFKIEEKTVLFELPVIEPEPVITPDPKPEKVAGVDWPSSDQKTEIIDWSAPVEDIVVPTPTAAPAPEPEYIPEPTPYTWGGQRLTASLGTIQGPSGTERYYNLDMSGVVNITRNQGIEGDYWVRDDGVKMYGNYIICACGFSVRPRGTIIETSLGTGMCLDTGGFAATDPYMVDIAVTW